MPTFATFWAGEAPSPLEMTCLASFARRGHEVTLYSYEPYGGLPDGVLWADAREVAEEATTRAFVVAGRPSLSHFSDWFRYNLFVRTPHAWVDADMMLLQPLGEGFEGRIVAREREDSVCGAIMRLEPADSDLGRLLGRTRQMMGVEIAWGATGPRLLTEVFGREATFAGSREPRDFFPIPHDEFWRVLLPSERAWCDEACRGALGAHLWHNIVERTGYWKALLPPAGSWLRARVEDEGTAGLFGPAYPERVVERIVENWHMRKTGSDLGIGALARQVLPSMARTLRHRRGRP